MPTPQELEQKFWQAMKSDDDAGSGWRRGWTRPADDGAA